MVATLPRPAVDGPSVEPGDPEWIIRRAAAWVMRGTGSLTSSRLGRIWQGGTAGPARPPRHRPYPTALVGFRLARYTRSTVDDLYRDYILEHYRRPHNFGVIAAPSVSLEGSNPLCGDRITLQLRVEDGVLREVAFTGRGCAISQASASLLTDEIKGKPLADVEGFRADDLLDLLGIEISPARLKCAMLSHDTLRKALDELGTGDGTASAEATGVAHRSAEEGEGAATAGSAAVAEERA